MSPSVPPSVDVSATVNNAAVDMGSRYFFELVFSFIYIFPKIELLDRMVIVFFIFEDPSYCKWMHHLQSQQERTRVPFSPHPRQHRLSLVFVF